MNIETMMLQQRIIRTHLSLTNAKEPPFHFLYDTYTYHDCSCNPTAARKTKAHPLVLIILGSSGGRSSEDFDVIAHRLSSQECIRLLGFIL